nr:hypothetical protein [Tanacetum cinerariifolium]
AFGGNPKDGKISGKVRPVNAAGSQSTVNHPRPISQVIPRIHSQQTRPFNKLSSNKRSVFNKKVNTIRVNNRTARERAVGNPQQKDYKEKEVIDSGYSRHMTGNKCYLTDLEAFDGIENQLYCKVKVTKSDNETEFKNSVMTQFCDDKGIKREYSVSRTPQQNRVAERRNKTLIEAARTMALVTKPQNKTPYELIRGRPPLIDFMKPFGCPVTILNTRDNLGMFEGKADEGYLLGNGLDWLFDIDSLTISMNYVPVVTGNQTNGIAGTKEKLVAGQDEKKKELEQEYILIPICTTGPLISQDANDSVEDA